MLEISIVPFPRGPEHMIEVSASWAFHCEGYEGRDHAVVHTSGTMMSSGRIAPFAARWQQTFEGSVILHVYQHPARGGQLLVGIYEVTSDGARCLVGSRYVAAPITV